MVNFPPLRFHADGSFRILMLSDLQETLHHDGKTLRAINGLLDETKPDLVLLGGDNCYGPDFHDPMEIREYLRIFTAPMAERRIPWAHVFGNHDHDLEIDDRVLQAVYEETPFCISGHTPETVHGVTNCVLPVYGNRDDSPVFNVWLMDTNNLAEDYMKELGIEGGWKLPVKPDQQGGWDKIRFDQIMWYYTTSMEMEKAAGRKIPGMLMTHAALWEHALVRNNPKETGLTGETVERTDLGVLNSGLFSAMLERGDIRLAAAGHTHMDDFCGKYMGITLCLDGCAGWAPYGTDSIRGGRVFDLHEADPANITTFMVRSAKYI